MRVGGFGHVDVDPLDLAGVDLGPQLEINAYRYLAATIVQFFGSQPTDSDLRAAADPSAQQEAMARWLRPAVCQARTVCSTAGALAGTSGAPCSTIGADWHS
jgi:hypothetical protein